MRANSSSGWCTSKRYAFAKQKQKKQAEKEALDPDANYTEDKGDFEIPVEDEPEENDEEDTEPI